MKNIFYILLLLPTIIFAQYPSNSGHKITLGEQTTADGLIWRGVAADTTTTVKSDTAAYFVLDTVNKKLYFYKVSAIPKWNEISGSGGGGSGTVTSITGGTGLTGGTITTSGTLAADTSFLFTQSDSLSLNLTSRFAAKQNTLTNPVTGTGTNNYIPKFTSTGSIIGNSTLIDDGSTVSTASILSTTNYTAFNTTQTMGVNSGSLSTHRFTSANANGVYNKDYFLTSYMGAPWQGSDIGGGNRSKPPIVAIVNNNDPSFINSGLHLMTTNSTNNTYAPAITFGANSENGAYFNTIGAITAKKLGTGQFTSLSTGQLEFFGSGTSLDATGGSFTNANMTLGVGLGIGYTTAPTVRGRLIVSEKIGINNDTPTSTLDVGGTLKVSSTSSFLNTVAINSSTTSGALLILKNSQEPVRDASWLTNQTFDSGANWTLGTGWSITGGEAVATAATGDLTYTTLPDTIIGGRYYEITYTQSAWTAGTATIRLGNASGAIPQYTVTNGKLILVPSQSTGGFRISTSTYTGKLDNISIAEIRNPLSVLQGTQLSSSNTINYPLRATSNNYYIGGGGAYNTNGNNISIGVNAGASNTTGTSWLAEGTNAGLSNISGNNWLAQGNGAAQNNTSGSDFLAQGNSTGFRNTIGSSWMAQGTEAGFNNINGSFWIAQGYRAAYNNTTGSYFIASGTNAAFNNTTGSNFVAQGFEAAGSSTTGSNFVAQGYGAGYGSTTGSNWVAQGFYAGGQNTTGSNWVAQGSFSSFTNNTGTNFLSAGAFSAYHSLGSNYVSIGYEAGRRYSNGSDAGNFTNSTYVGFQTNVGGTSGQRTNENVFGYAATGQGNNTVMLGNSSIDATNGLFCYDTGIASPSDARDKTNIENLNTGLELILALRPVKFTWNMRDYGNVGNKDIGFIAQEVDKVQNIAGESDNIKLVNTNNDDQYWMQRDNLIPILVKAIQQQQTQIELLKERILKLENK